MTKRLGFSEAQMRVLIERTADLSAGKTDLNGGIERVTAAMRGEAEASEYLGLTLNETYIKSWYDAHDATGVAWKDLTDIQKAQVRYNVFLEQSGPLAGKAAGSINTLAGAYSLVRKEISDNIGQNENAVAATKHIAETIAAHADELGNLVTVMINAAARTVEFIANNWQAIAAIGAFVGGTKLMKMGIDSVNTVLLIKNGLLKHTPDLIGAVTERGGKMVEMLRGSATAINSVTGLLGKMSLIGGAAFVGWQIGEFLNNFGIVKSTMLGIIHHADLVRLTVKKMWRQITGGDVGEVEREIAVAKTAYGELLAEIESRGEKTADNSKQAQEQITADIESETAKQVAAVQKASEEMAAAYASVDAEGTAAKDNVPDEFGLTKKDRDNLAAELAKRDEQKKAPVGGMNNQIVKENGVFTNYASEILNRRPSLPSVPSLPENIQQGKASASPAKVHELKFQGGSLRGSESDVEALLNNLAQAGMSAA
jgi:hypothetical protein